MSASEFSDNTHNHESPAVFVDDLDSKMVHNHAEASLMHKHHSQLCVQADDLSLEMECQNEHYLDCEKCVIHFPDCRECIITCALQSHQHPKESDESTRTGQIRQKCPKLKIKLQSKTQQQKQLLQNYLERTVNNMDQTKLRNLAKATKLPYHKVYKWVWDQNQRMCSSRRTECQKMHRQGLVFFTQHQKIFKIEKII